MEEDGVRGAEFDAADAADPPAGGGRGPAPSSVAIPPRGAPGRGPDAARRAVSVLLLSALAVPTERREGTFAHEPATAEAVARVVSNGDGGLDGGTNVSASMTNARRGQSLSPIPSREGSRSVAAVARENRLVGVDKFVVERVGGCVRLRGWSSLDHGGASTWSLPRGPTMQRVHFTEANMKQNSDGSVQQNVYAFDNVTVCRPGSYSLDVRVDWVSGEATANCHMKNTQILLTPVVRRDNETHFATGHGC